MRITYRKHNHVAVFVFLQSQWSIFSWCDFCRLYTCTSTAWGWVLHIKIWQSCADPVVSMWRRVSSVFTLLPIALSRLWFSRCWKCFVVRILHCCLRSCRVSYFLPWHSRWHSQMVDRMLCCGARTDSDSVALWQTWKSIDSALLWTFSINDCRQNRAPLWRMN